MNTAAYTLITPENRADYRELISGVSEAVWPEFMRHDPIAIRLWDDLFERFPDYQFALFDHSAHQVVALANSVPLAWNADPALLPEEGWDWAFLQSVEDHAGGSAPHTLCGLQIAIVPDFQGRGLSSRMLQAMRSLAAEKELQRVIVPVRPSMKSRYPLTPMESYIAWRDDAGLPFDPWLRVHVRLGGEIVKVCHQAMRIVGSVSEWRAWTGIPFPETGQYVVPGALVPVAVDVEKDEGIYLEPNVWVVHQADNP